jgi:hypothetical protein
MNIIIINDCSDCNYSCPSDSYGAGLMCIYENNKGIVIPGNELERFPIPDWCPKNSYNFSLVSSRGW